MTDEFDYIIVGTGSAGSAVAFRLAEAGASVCALEAGGSDRSIFIRMPSALSIPMSMPRYSWGYVSEPEPALGGRRLYAPRGRVIGGSSSINGMVYVRGHARDFDRWAEEGAEGWAYRDVLPYFRRSETRAEGGDAYRGDSGPLRTRYGTLRNPLYRAFVQAGVEAGYPETTDINGAQQEGFGRMDMTIHRGERWSAARAYLAPALKTGRLDIRREALATRILFEGRRAAGLAYLRDGQERIVRARREVVVAGGAFNSPQLLMLSGLGPAADLAAAGIAPLADRPGVGANLQDHLEFYYQVSSLQPITLFSWLNPVGKAMIGMRWLAQRDGLGATNHFETCGFIRSRAGLEHPDIQFHFLPAAITYDGRAHATQHGFQAHVGTLRSRSRGRVWLASNDPRARPRILFNYMSDPQDWTEMRAALRLTREIFAQPAFDPYRGAELSPGPDVRSDAEIDDWLRAHIEGAYHPCGTCRMGRADDPRAVTDAQARVIGVEGLRVVDASIMPSVTSGNLNAPTIMIGEKAADHILGRTPLAASNAQAWIAPEWRTRQRTGAPARTIEPAGPAAT